MMLAQGGEFIRVDCEEEQGCGSVEVWLLVGVV